MSIYSREFEGKTLANFETPNNDLVKVKDIVHRYLTNMDENIMQGNGLLICGVVNCGKTHLACAIAKAFKKRASSGNNIDEPKFSVKMEDYLDIIIECKQSIGQEGVNEWEIMRKYAETNVLILDDFMVDTKTSEWVGELTYWLINQRYINRLPTIITTNHTLKELEIMFGFYGARIVSRLQRMNEEKPIWIGKRR